MRYQAFYALEEILTPEIVSRLRTYRLECEDEEVCQAIEEILNEAYEIIEEE